MSTEIEDFDIQEWKEVFSGVFYNRLKPDMFCFRCEEKVEEKVEEAVATEDDNDPVTSQKNVDLDVQNPS